MRKKRRSEQERKRGTCLGPEARKQRRSSESKIYRGEESQKASSQNTDEEKQVTLEELVRNEPKLRLSYNQSEVILLDQYSFPAIF